MSTVSFNELISKKTLIIGDVGTGKTSMTKKLLIEAIKNNHRKDITIIEMAPQTKKVKDLVVGGTLLNAKNSQVRCLEGRDIKTPRLSARDGDELLGLAEYNTKEIGRLLQEFIIAPTKILFINDVSIYLQGGDINRLWEVLEKAETVVANGYKGEKLKNDFGTGLSNRESRLMETLANRMDLVLCL